MPPFENHDPTAENLAQKVENITPAESAASTFKSGFIAIVGRANCGKSTLLNALVGTKLSIVTPKPQTTRKNLKGVRTDENTQIIFIDTPGIHLRDDTELNAKLKISAMRALVDTDLAVVVIDCTRGLGEEETHIFRALSKSETPIICAINKVDLIEKVKILPLIAHIQNMASIEEIIPISAKTEDGLDALLLEIKKRLPLGPKYYDDDTITDVHLREMCSEIVREKLFLALREELPYSTIVEIESFKELENAGKELVEICAAIYVDKRSQKGIVIGKGGAMLKELGSLARLDMEKLLQKKVMLKLYCRIKEGWRDDPSFLREMGF